MDNETCVGFADCPCRRCRDTRLAVTEAHKGGHAHPGDRSYCGACKAEDRQAYYSRWLLPPAPLDFECCASGACEVCQPGRGWSA